MKSRTWSNFYHKKKHGQIFIVYMPQTDSEYVIRENIL